MFVYFAFHTISGRNGMRSYFEIKRIMAEQQHEFERLKTEREQLERRVSLLGNNAIDRDLLEERCRSVLNYAFPDDVIIDEKTIY
jgi:cell division protein FtsB